MRLFKRSTQPRIIEKTVALDGTAGNGAIGTVALFTLTGRVWVTKFTAVCTESCVSAGGGSISIGTASAVGGLHTPPTLATNIVLGDILSGATSAPGAQAGITNKVLNESVIMDVTTAAITDGTIVVAIEYIPLTSDGLLVPA